jgi:tRNA1Val (adenine37-N6)-methyltransferase
MPNNYFQFKQFTVHQDKCAMKVCTDACLFGAVVAENYPTAGICLDIGTGTGLLSLMYAQKNPVCNIDAVEIDKVAAEQAEQNFAASAWANRLNIINADIFAFSTQKKYDCIISNPPFFEDDLKSKDMLKNNAKHDTTLSLTGLLKIVKEQLSTAGIFAVLLPFHRVNNFIEEANGNDLYLIQQLLIKQTPTHDFFRGILFFSQTKRLTIKSEMIIKSEEGNYTDEFTAALKDYYLYL